MQAKAGWVVAGVVAAAALISIVLAQESQTAEVRINARQLDDGRVEFALQQRDGSGWSERVLPRSRFFPSNLNHNRWLNSSPIALGAPTPEAARPTDAQTPPASGVDLPIAAELTPGEHLSYFAGDREAIGFRTYLGITGTTNDSLYESASLVFFCDRERPGGNVWVWSNAYVPSLGVIDGDASLNDTDGVAQAKFGKVYEGRWEQHGLIAYDDSAEIADATSFFALAKQNDFVQISLPRYGSDIIATFDLRGAFSTPIQPNLDRCGEY